MWRGVLVRPSLTFPAPPLKFRTLSSPQSGFKPWRLSINPTLPESATGVKHQVYIPPATSQFDSAFVALWPSCHSGGFLRPPSLGPPVQPPRPTGPWLRTGYVVPFLLATPTLSASLTDSRCFPRISGYTAGLCPATWSGLPARPSLLWVSTPSLRAITPAPRGGARDPSLPSFPTAFLHRTRSRLLYFPSLQLL